MKIANRFKSAMKKLCLVSALSCLSSIFVPPVSHSIAAVVIKTGGVQQKSSPTDLLGLASKMFPPDLARQVEKKISEEVVRELQKGSAKEPKSIATLFLADRLYRSIKVGEFTGTPAVRWNGFNVETGRPTFVYVPEQPTAFSFRTASGRTITPGTMNTDGGSIPSILHPLKGFSPWGYGPGYIIHDWLFVAHKCGFPPDNDVSFERSAMVLAEAMKTLMDRGFVNYDGVVQKFPKAEDTLYLVYQAVRSKIARKLWNTHGNVECRSDPAGVTKAQATK